MNDETREHRDTPEPPWSLEARAKPDEAATPDQRTAPAQHTAPDQYTAPDHYSIPPVKRYSVRWITLILLVGMTPLAALLPADFYEILRGWNEIDSWIVVTAALAGMGCALPGVFLVLRKQSMTGDALSHTVLPGIVVALLISQHFGLGRQSEHGILFAGAMAFGILAAVLTEWIQKLGRVESSAALGVVFTTLFAAGLLLVRMKADNVHIDPDCVLYGNVETVTLSKPVIVGSWRIPPATLTISVIFLVDLVAVVLFFKELRICSFDPALATTLGINANIVHYGLMAATAATLVAAFEIVGSILVIAMLIAPAATANLLTDRLSRTIAYSLLIAGGSAVLGHLFAITLPPIVFRSIGFDTVDDASTAGMMAVACGLLFVFAALFAPQYGLVSKAFVHLQLSVRIVGEDILGLLYREEERDRRPAVVGSADIDQALSIHPWRTRLAVWHLRWRGKLAVATPGWRLTDVGRQSARELVRSHRLWESYMDRHFDLPPDHLHESAARVEHFLDGDMRDRLASELHDVDEDPHGRAIPPERR